MVLETMRYGCLASFLSLSTWAQPPPVSDTPTARLADSLLSRFYASGYVGLIGPMGDAARYSQVGFRTNTALEYRIRPRFWVTTSLIFDLYPFKRTDNGVTIQGKASVVQLNLITNYSLLPGATYQPYIGGGAGLTFLSGPVAEANYDSRQVSIRSKGAFYLAFQAGLGLQRTLRHKFTGFVETYYQLIPAVDYAGITNLEQVSVQAGIKTPIKLMK